MSEPRLLNAFGDVVCAVQHLYFAYDWLCRRAKPGLGRPHFLYALHLLAVSAFCVLGAAIHIFDPMPARATPLWFAFILTMGASFASIPTMLVLVFRSDLPAASLLLCQTWPVCACGAHALLISVAPELGHGSAANDPKFDLLAGCVQSPSVPCARGDCLCLHGGLGALSMMAAVALGVASLRYGFATNISVDMEAVKKLTLALSGLVVVLAILPFMIEVVGFAAVVDLWHCLAFVGLLFANLAARPLMCEPWRPKIH